MALKITIAENEVEFDRIAAWQIIREMLVNPKAVIGLSTGRTTKNMHFIAGDIYKTGPFDTSKVTIFGLDEVINIPRDYAGACYTMLKNEIVDPLEIKDENFIIPPTLSGDFEKECEIFQSELERRGDIDLQILGLGTNGHLGFNQPGTPFGQETWVSAMDKELETRIRKETNTPVGKKLGGITLGLKNIMHSCKILLVAKGEAKADIVKEMLYGPVTTDIPASILQLHPNCEFLLDKAAAKYIT
ncbi:glucosamine-6-phosphate deaminase [Dysgonomonas hofstadii]|uniref:Glucosamine-6-phosphate deaminase n=1 Tax=Dysgonomonas hofstadii TaxID=637886 RepID=A0A840CNZ2_9BACT|nr:glucosamine-6-phosphate deaminase [Dysgonomonas hofstadii]MBB4034292.1 glucosamine-6-phosphate deaminase [Dysgonomonas hofstadii]